MSGYAQLFFVITYMKKVHIMHKEESFFFLTKQHLNAFCLCTLSQTVNKSVTPKPEDKSPTFHYYKL